MNSFFSSRHSAPAAKRAAFCLALGLLATLSAAAYTPEPYVPRPVPPPEKDAPYLLPDGSIYIPGNVLDAPFVDRLNEIFCRTHPGFRFTVNYSGTGGWNAVSAGKAAFGPNAKAMTPGNQKSFESRWGYPATEIQLGWDNNPTPDRLPPGKFPPGAWVNSVNPTPEVSLEQLNAILTVGNPKGDITHWGQIDYHDGPVGTHGGEWAFRSIHVYMAGVPLPVVNSMHSAMGGLQWSPRIEYLPSLEDVINAVATDPFGLGVTGWFPNDWGWDKQAEYQSKVRFLGLTDYNGRVSHGGIGDLSPLAGGMTLVVNKPPGKPLEPWIAEYMRLALSKDGQDIVASLVTSEGIIPLDPEQIPKELAKLK